MRAIDVENAVDGAGDAGVVVLAAEL